MSARAPSGSERLRERMVERQLRRRGIADERVLEAMRRVPREAFVPEPLADRAYDDAALPIGDEQTISQPYIVAAMCEQLALEGSEYVLDVGTGSGYAAAVLDELAAGVVSVERIERLAERARRAGRDGALGRRGARRGRLARGAGARPFDAIAVAAATPAIPPGLYDQLVEGGRMVLPLGRAGGQRLVRVVRTEQGPVETSSLGCRFVPLVTGVRDEGSK